MKIVSILALGLLSVNAHAALRDPGHYTGRCHGVSVMAQYENGKEIQSQTSNFRYELEIDILAEGEARIETQKSKLYSDFGPNGAEFTTTSKLEEVSPGRIRQTNIGLGGVCEYQVDRGGVEVWLGCTDKNGKLKPPTGTSTRFRSKENVEYSEQRDLVSASPKKGEKFSGWALAYSNLWCTSEPAAK